MQFDSTSNSTLILNTLTANYEYSRKNRENLPLPIQMQLSAKVKTFEKTNKQKKQTK